MVLYQVLSVTVSLMTPANLGYEFANLRYWGMPIRVISQQFHQRNTCKSVRLGKSRKRII